MHASPAMLADARREVAGLLPAQKLVFTQVLLTAAAQALPPAQHWVRWLCLWETVSSLLQREHHHAACAADKSGALLPLTPEGMLRGFAIVPQALSGIAMAEEDVCEEEDTRLLCALRHGGWHSAQAVDDFQKLTAWMATSTANKKYPATAHSTLGSLES
eukprot:CAMPEP_0115854066 /NCGR_PEP_ID=MMETSP0287-20121206/13830_1 /TAXON_ID=412157 /ORGANISM="Chrysochromulina rotalis, Strain UIO044" /LENGTH=159 /DNA_ID=CAMNT_0003308167 /DNA_START=279 /DNA_END=760 /DNA_ORIENTATION=-